MIGSPDQFVCAVGSSSGGHFYFGTAGNSGDGMTYGTAAITDALTTATAGDHFTVTCNAFNFGQGIYAPHASITARRVDRIVLRQQ